MKMTAYEMPRRYWAKVAERNGILRNTFNYRLRASQRRSKGQTGINRKGQGRAVA